MEIFLGISQLHFVIMNDVRILPPIGKKSIIEKVIYIFFYFPCYGAEIYITVYHVIHI